MNAKEVVIIKHRSGNTKSVELAVQRCGFQPVVTNDARIIASAERVICPGQADAAQAMKALSDHQTLEVIRQLTQPFLGICLGLQLLGTHSEERDTPLLGILPMDVKRFSGHFKVPHIGWNAVYFTAPSPLSEGIPSGACFYFAHSYRTPPNAWTWATTEYEESFCAGLHYRNFHAVQFHPEKSGAFGQTLLTHFLHLKA
jgi:glutamine amidotransferase